MEPKFKKGDHVRIRKDLQPIEREFPLPILDTMVLEAGKESCVLFVDLDAFTSEEGFVSKSHSYKIRNSLYYWPEDALELTCIDMGPKFKVGDKVIILKKVSNLNEIGGMIIHSEMRKLSGTITIVRDIWEENDKYYYRLSCGFVWPKEALQKF